MLPSVSPGPTVLKCHPLSMTRCIPESNYQRSMLCRLPGDKKTQSAPTQSLRLHLVGGGTSAKVGTKLSSNLKSQMSARTTRFSKRPAFQSRDVESSEVFEGVNNKVFTFFAAASPSLSTHAAQLAAGRTN
jgi:hypothetical protein